MKISTYLVFIILLIICFVYIFVVHGKSELNSLVSTSTDYNSEESKNVIERIDYSGVLNNLSNYNSPPAGYTLLSSTTEYLFNHVGSSIINHDFTTFAVKFGACNLGSKSYIQITSLEDSHTQILTTQTLAEWRNVSALFNGEYAKIDVFKHDLDSGVSCTVDQLITTGISHTQNPNNPPCSGGTVCSYSATADLDRIPSNHDAVAHKIGGFLSTSTNYKGLINGNGGVGGPGGTVWLTSNGGFASAGHVIGNSPEPLFQQVHFNTPSSSEDGAITAPSPDHQYAIDYSSIERSFNNGNGDWAVFSVFPNPNTGLLPFEAQESFIRVGKDNIPASGFKYGHGQDVFPTGTCGSLNSSNRTQQRATATNINFPSSSWGRFNWSGINDGGDSGSPVVVIINSVEIAIGTNTNCGNYGTSFNNSDFANELSNLFGTSITYIDLLHPSPTSEGNIIRPYKSIADGVNGATNGETLSIAKGFYNETMTITKPLTLSAPVGTVTIGASGSPKVNPDFTTEDVLVEDHPKMVELAQNYPNPFNPTTTINYQVPASSQVSLKVYNSIGREVAVLVNESKQPGKYSVNFDASGLASGIYFYVLRTGSKELIKQMTLIK